MTVADKVAQHGWQTGAVVAQELLSQLNAWLARPGEPPARVTNDDWLVVVSQTCDIVAAKDDAEPLVEVLLCKPFAGKPRKGRVNLKSTRYLDFRPNRRTHPDLVLSAHAIADRYVIPRGVLAAHVPDRARRLDDIASRRVLDWYALRAARPAWPQQFCDRIRNARPALEDALDLFTAEIAEVRVAIAEKECELGEREDYHVAVYFVVDEETWDGDVEGRAAIHTAFAGFATALQNCAGVEVNQELSGVVSGGAFTWQATQQTDRWNFANLSYRD